MEKLSIIMPVYNTEKYIDRAIKSILNQKIDFELIIIDDGSSDNSYDVCKKYSLNNENIKLYHQSNSGQSVARNKGISLATGKYITFVDSDDWIASGIYLYGLRKLREYKADVFDFNCKKVSTNEQSNVKENKDEKVMIYEDDKILEEYLKKGLCENNCPFSICRKIFKIELFKDVKFPEGKINEDIITVYKVLQNTKKMICTNQVGYYYFQTDNSTTRNGLKSKDFDLLEICDDLYELAKQKGGKIEYYAKIKKYRCPFSILSKIAYYGILDKNLDEKVIVKNMQKELRENILEIIKSPMQKNRKILAVLYCINFRITSKLVKLVKKIKRYVVK